MHLVEMKVEGYGSFHVTNSFAKTIVGLISEAESLSRLAYPDIDLPITLYLEEVNPRGFIRCLKEYRALTGMSLKDAKARIDVVRGGGRIKLGIFSQKEASEIKTLFEEAGGAIGYPGALELLARAAE